MGEFPSIKIPSQYISIQNLKFAFFIYMAKKLLLDLAKTYLFSFVVSFIVNFIYYLVHSKNAGNGYDFGHVLPLLIVGALYINFILLIMSLPALFLHYPHIWSNVIVRSILYFSGPVVFLVAILSMDWKEGDSLVYLLTCLIFLAIRLVFYLRLTRSFSKSTLLH